MTDIRSNKRSSRSFVAICGPGLAVALWSAGCAAPKPRAAVPAPEARPLTLFLIGDSTMSDKPVIPAYPGARLGPDAAMYFKPEVRVANHARNGRSSKSFRDEGRWSSVLALMKPGDYVIIQFGHNDEKKGDAARFTESFGEFKQNLKRYVQEARAAQAVPVLATPVARRRFGADGQVPGYPRRLPCSGEASSRPRAGTAGRPGKAEPGTAVEDGPRRIQAPVRLGGARRI